MFLVHYDAFTNLVITFGHQPYQHIMVERIKSSINKGLFISGESLQVMESGSLEIRASLTQGQRWN